jgi:hypothetical protein
MTKYIIEFKDKSFNHGRRLDIETFMQYINGKVLVEISDFTVKNGAIDKDWIPCHYVGQIMKDTDGNLYQSFDNYTEELRLQLLESNVNPKYKYYTKEEFDNIFNVIKEIEI